MPPNPVFVKSQCFWPEEIGLEEKFDAKWTLQNSGSSGEVFFGITYKGKSYFILVNGEKTFHMEDAQSGTLSIKDCTIKSFFAGIEEFKETTTIEVIWLLGYYDQGAPDGQQYPISDSWTVRTYVKVGGRLPVPTWMVAAGAGLGVVAVTGIVLTTRKKR
jgi:hypothetical protein